MKLVSYLFVMTAMLTGCAYKLGGVGRSLPGGYKEIEVPIFTNSTHEVGIEMAFTNSLVQEIERNKVAAVRKPGGAATILKGEIREVTYKGSAPVQIGDKAPLLPDGAVLATSYRVIVRAKLTMLEKKSGRVIWTSDFVGETSYVAPQVTVARVNTVNPLYNLSARRRAIEALAENLMVQAHDRLTENF